MKLIDLVTVTFDEKASALTRRGPGLLRKTDPS